jgi:hypothetical protein
MSTSTSKPSGSSITIEHDTPSSRIPSPHGELGLAEQSNSIAAMPLPGRLKRPGEVDIRDLLPPSTAFGEKDLTYLSSRPELDQSPAEHLEQWRLNMVELIEEHNQRFAPVTGDDLADALAVFADMLGCNVPTEAGLQLYMLAMSDVPAKLMPHAAIRLAAVHKFSRLPLPADFRKVVEPELELVELRKKRIFNALDHVMREINQRRHRATALYQE